MTFYTVLKLLINKLPKRKKKSQTADQNKKAQIKKKD